MTSDPLRAAARAMWYAHTEDERFAGPVSADPYGEFEDALLAALASQPETRGQEADEAWEDMLVEFWSLGVVRPDAIFNRHRPLIDIALRGQVREGLDVERLARAIEVPETVYPGSVDVDGMKVARRIIREYARLSRLSGGEGK